MEQTFSDETFVEPKTGLGFPVRLDGGWSRVSVTRYPKTSVGVSVVYGIKGWLGGTKVLLSVDIYNKGMEGIPSGPGSPLVVIELYNCMHYMFPTFFSVDITSLFPPGWLEQHACFSSLDIPANVVDYCQQNQIVDDTGHFRLCGHQMTANTPSPLQPMLQQRECYIFVFMTAYKDQFVKVQITDLTKGRMQDTIKLFMRRICAEMEMLKGI